MAVTSIWPCGRSLCILISVEHSGGRLFHSVPRYLYRSYRGLSFVVSLGMLAPRPLPLPTPHTITSPGPPDTPPLAFTNITRTRQSLTVTRKCQQSVPGQAHIVRSLSNCEEFGNYNRETGWCSYAVRVLDQEDLVSPRAELGTQLGREFVDTNPGSLKVLE